MIHLNRTHKRLCASVSVLALLVTSATQSAQAQVEDEVVVTGSRIAVDNAAEAISPVVAIGSSDIATSGQIDISELLRESPQLQGSLPGNFSAFNGGALGVGQLNLRGLGTERTLVLQNGRRHVAGVQGTGAVDVNTISVALLDRIDVLTGGASSIYGADAVTGVVNFIMRDGASFDGFEVRGQAGISTKGDAEEYFVSIANGTEFADGRGDFVFAFEYNNSSSITAGSRDFAGSGLASLEGNAPAAQTALGIDPRFSNIFVTNTSLPISSGGGIISLGTLNNPPSAFLDAALSGGVAGCGRPVGTAGFPGCQIFDGGQLRPYNPGDIFLGPFSAIGGDAVPTEPDDELLFPDNERFILTAETSYELSENINFFANAKYAYSETFESNQVNGFNDDIPISLDNPFIPAQLRSQIDTLIAEGETPLVTLSRDTLDIAARPNPVAERSTLRLVAGFDGNIPALDLNYELSVNYGRVDADITNQNTRIEDRFFAAADAVIDPNTGEVVCRSTLTGSTTIPGPDFPAIDGTISTFDPGPGSPCVPINLFGFNSITPEAAAFSFLPTTSQNKLEQKVFLASFSGDTERYFSLPGGPLAYAFGYEYREEDSSFISDGLVQSGLTFGSNNSGPTLPSGGTYSVDEVFGEVRAPIVSDLPFVDFLELNAAYRYSDYSTIGTTDAWSAGARWGVTPDLTLRGTVSEAVRSPNINELFAPLQPDSIGATQDPCNPQFINAGTEFRAANCAQFVAPGFDSTNFNSAFVPGQSGGNILLNEEEATTYTVGAVWRPSSGFLSGSRFIVDYYNIEIEGLIDTLSAFQIAQNCVDLPTINNQFCDQIFRDPTDGFITGFVSGEINLGSVQTEGIDFTLTHEFDTSSLISFADESSLELGVLGTYFLSFDEVRDPTAPDEVVDGQGVFTRPDWIVNFNADLTLDLFEFGWRVRYEDSQLLPGIAFEDLENDPDFANFTETGDSFVHDFTVSYNASDAFQLYGGVNNVFDREPYLASLSRPAGPRGRFVFAGFRSQF